MSFAPGNLADRLSEAAGYKAGLALSIVELCDHLAGTPFPDIILESEQRGARLRSEEYEALFYKLLYRIGYTDEEYDGDYTGAKRIHKYRREGLVDEYVGVVSIFNEMWRSLTEAAVAAGASSIDPTPYVERCREVHGAVGVVIAIEQIEVFHRAMSLNPHSTFRAHEWEDQVELRKLFSGSSVEPTHGRFIDQRFINYLCNNSGKLPEVHWRKFEQLTAEYFHKEGYVVEIGPGSNDDGVDVRVWMPGADPADSPLCLVQCKRQRAKVCRVVVKGLYADVRHEGASFGVIVTASELSPGARKTVTARGYPIQAVERAALKSWLSRLRRLGAGIVRV